LSRHPRFSNKHTFLPTCSAILVFPGSAAAISSLILLIRKESANLEGIPRCLIDELESFRAKELAVKHFDQEINSGLLAAKLTLRTTRKSNRKRKQAKEETEK
jgi:hypothetical protein